MLHFLHDELLIIQWTDIQTCSHEQVQILMPLVERSGLSNSELNSSAPSGPSGAQRKAQARLKSSVPPWSAFQGALSSLGKCRPPGSLSRPLFACASLFIANRALNLTLQMDIAPCASACAREAINNVSYENLIISVFSPLAISLYLCPLSDRIWSQYSKDEVWMKSNTRGYKTLSRLFGLENISSLYYFFKQFLTIQ